MKNYKIFLKFNTGMWDALARYALLMVILPGMLLILSGCANQYSHYQPSLDDCIQMEFDYPKEWMWDKSNISISEVDQFMLLGSDPNLPTSTTRLDRPRIGVFPDPFMEIMVDSMNPGYLHMDLAEAVRWVKRPPLHDYSDLEILVDEEVEIDGYAGWHFILQWSYPKPLGRMTKESYIVMVDDVIYEIKAYIPVDQRSKEFTEAYKHIVETINILEPSGTCNKK